MSFLHLGLSDEVLKAVSEAGYTEPTPIQRGAIPVILQGRDVLGTAQTGTGKTAGFTLPMIDILAQGRARARMPRSLILEPTRELAAQVDESFEKYGKYNKLTTALLIGGVSFADQNKKLDRGVDVLIATPGRLLDHFERGRLMLTGVEILVIDEADRMLDMGFIPDVEKICKLMPQRPQTLFFSATMPPAIQRLTKQFLNDPRKVEVAGRSSAATTVTQYLVNSAPRDKEKTLEAILKTEDIQNGIIFCNRKVDLKALYSSLRKKRFDVAQLHGDMPQSERMEVLAAFKDNKVKLLMASDVAARGLDIPAVSHVINYDVPMQAEDYVHRIGRTGRAGRAGTSFTIATRRDEKYVDAIEKLSGKKLPIADPIRGKKPIQASTPTVDPAAAAPAAPADAAPVATAPADVAPATQTPADKPDPAAEKPARSSRSRSRSRGRNKPKSDQAAEVPTPAAKDEPKSDTPAPEQAAAPAKGTRQKQGQRQDAKQAQTSGAKSGRKPRNDGQKDKGQKARDQKDRGQKDQNTVGWGEYMPAFMGSQTKNDDKK